jgi:PDZ domain-containing protein/aspartyl protease
LLNPRADTKGSDPVVVAAKLDAEGFSQLLVPITVNSHRFWCNVDSGGSWVLSLDATKARNSGLQPNATGSSAGVGPNVIQDQRVRGTTVTVGNIVLRDITVILVDRPSVAPDIECVFGLDLLKDYVVEFDYTTPTLRIFEAGSFRASPRAMSLPLTMDRVHNPYTSAGVRLGDGGSLDLNLMVDTGAGYFSAVLLKNVLDENRVRERVGTVVSQWSDTPGMTIEAARPSALTVGPFEIPAPVAAMISTPTGGTLQNGMIGLGFLRRFTVTFDYGRQQVWLEPNARLRERHEFDTSGIEFRPNRDGAYAVVVVAPGSPGDNAGLRQGDLLRAIDGRDVRDLTFGEIKARLSRIDERCVLRVKRGEQLLKVTVHLRNRL